MRRKDREIAGIDEKIALLENCKVCRLGLSENATPYIVPLNLGYAFSGDKLTLFFHSAGEGKKLDIMRKNSRACFEIDTGHELKQADTACNYGFAFASLVGFGVISLIEDREEKIQALNYLMLHQTGKESPFQYNNAELNAVTVYKMDVAEFTGKSSPA
jgi:nitroimidazol reductase NimA-like FMN-containing flavoprotein (pyridoxamine 5'-phosphate oxidase superfamily)